jgi:hypothetical protein
VADSVHSLRIGTPETSHHAHIAATVLDLGEFVLSGSSSTFAISDHHRDQVRPHRDAR